jgi:septum formation inhibitor MinC
LILRKTASLTGTISRSESFLPLPERSLSVKSKEAKRAALNSILELAKEMKREKVALKFKKEKKEEAKDERVEPDSGHQA